MKTGYPHLPWTRPRALVWKGAARGKCRTRIYKYAVTNSDAVFLIAATSASPYFPHRAAEHELEDLFAGDGVGHNDVLHLVVAGKGADDALEERLREGRVHHVW